MANGDDFFSFDDFDIDGGNDSNAFSQSNVNESSGFEAVNDSNNSSTKGMTKKTAITTMVLGVCLILVLFFVVNLVTRDKKPEESNQTLQSQVQSKPIKSNNANNTNTNNTNNWIEISEYNNITWNNNYINSTFSITGVKHYVKVVSDSNFEIKSVLSGALAGFTGTFELEVPYTYGTKLPIGESFKVAVLTGTDISGKIVVGDIKYNLG